jgi:hypothetical protein
MKTHLLALTVALTGTLMQPPAEAAWTKGSGGWGQGGPYARVYDPATVETIQGEVVTVDKFVPDRGMSKGVHLTLKTQSGDVSVHLGPEWFLERQDMRISPKDRLEVKGSRVTFDGKPAVIASEIHKGSETLKLREESGIPLWSGWRRSG